MFFTQLLMQNCFVGQCDLLCVPSFYGDGYRQTADAVELSLSIVVVQIVSTIKHIYVKQQYSESHVRE